MIFVTVGTHEQAFDRLLKAVDEIAEKGILKEEVIIQTGYSNYIPKHCTWKKLFPYEEMVKNVEEARIVITHGGPSSFIMPLQLGKIPIVVPRKRAFHEHVNDHQVEFAKILEERQKNIILLEDITKLESVILNYQEIVKNMDTHMNHNNARFNQELEKIVADLFENKA